MRLISENWRYMFVLAIHSPFIMPKSPLTLQVKAPPRTLITCKSGNDLFLSLILVAMASPYYVLVGKLIYGIIGWVLLMGIGNTNCSTKLEVKSRQTRIDIIRSMSTLMKLYKKKNDQILKSSHKQFPNTLQPLNTFSHCGDIITITLSIWYTVVFPWYLFIFCSIKLNLYIYLSWAGQSVFTQVQFLPSTVPR